MQDEWIDLVLAAMEVLPQPAALFEAGWPEKGEFLCRNQASEGFRAEYPDDQEQTHQVLLEMLDGGPPQQAHRETAWGELWVTTLEGGLDLARPDLVLVSLHRDVSPMRAKLDHEHLVLSIRLNEYSIRIFSALQTVRFLADATTGSVEQMLGVFNASAVEYFQREDYGRDLGPAGRRDLSP